MATSFFAPNTFAITFPTLFTLLESKCAYKLAVVNKDSKIIQKEFTQWKKEAKDKVNKMKKGKLTEDEVYKWLVENNIARLLLKRCKI